MFSVLQQLEKKHLSLDEIVETIVKRIGDVQKIILIGNYAKDIDSGLIEDLLIADEINLEYIDELEKKLKKRYVKNLSFGWNQKMRVFYSMIKK